MGFLSLAAAVSFSFASCSDDDDDENTDNNSSVNLYAVGADYSNPGTPVDLGLSVKWAPNNLGAKTPEADGGFYAWGETAIKFADEYNWAGYALGDGSNFSKYTNESGVTTLALSDDAANVNLGSGWRMPTYEETLELTNNCVAEWKTQNGATGYLFTAPNGNSIFIPAAGYLTDKGELAGHWSQGADASKGCYWSSTLHPQADTDAKDLFFYKGYLNGSQDQYYRYAAQPIRPVYDESLVK